MSFKDSRQDKQENPIDCETVNVEFLILGLKNPDPKVREFSAEQLGNIGDKRATKALLNTMINDKENIVQVVSASALEKIGDEAVVDPLLEACQSFYQEETVGVRCGQRGVLQLRALLCLLPVRAGSAGTDDSGGIERIG